MNQNKYRVIDLFAGAGGFSLGFEKAGFEIVAAVEFDKQIAETYAYNHSQTKLFNADIKELSGSVDFSAFNADVIIGGPPCQGFSMAGARVRKGFLDDPRNYLFKHYFKIVQQVKPKMFIIENVKGILTMKKGGIFKQIIDLFSNPDNFNGDKFFIKTFIVRAVNYGIPQTRERVFIVGSLNKDININSLLSVTKDELLKTYPHFFDKVTVWDAISNLTGENKDGFIKDLKPLNQYQEFLSNADHITFNHIKPVHNEIALNRIKQIASGEDYTVLNENIKSVFSGAYGRLIKDEPSPTITTRFDSPSCGRVIHPIEDRALSPREGARLQSFPDSFKFLGTKGSIYKQIGNAVPPKLAFFWAMLLKKALQENF